MTRLSSGGCVVGESPLVVLVLVLPPHRRLSIDSRPPSIDGEPPADDGDGDERRAGNSRDDEDEDEDDVDVLEEEGEIVRRGATDVVGLLRSRWVPPSQASSNDENEGSMGVGLHHPAVGSLVWFFSQLI
jgi:hypothetical protein